MQLMFGLRFVSIYNCFMHKETAIMSTKSGGALYTIYRECRHLAYARNTNLKLWNIILSSIPFKALSVRHNDLSVVKCADFL